MFIPLLEILEDPIFRSAQPQVLAARSALEEAKVRWVHATELLDIAHLLRGGELLLSTGQELLKLREEAQAAHVLALKERGISALVLEPYARTAQITPQLIEAAEQAKLPLIRLRHTVPFVDITERINRSIVSKQAATLQQADMLSQRLAQRIATSGPNLSPLLQMIGDDLGLTASLQSLEGQVLVASEGERIAAPFNVATDVVVGGDVAAHLVVECRQPDQAEHVSMIVQRLGSIISLAYAQHHRPSHEQLANHALMQAIIDDAGEHYLAERAVEAGMDTKVPLCVGVVQSHDMARLRTQIERALHGEVRPGCISLHNNRLYFLIELEAQGASRAREACILRLRQALGGLAMECAIGPLVGSVTRAPLSVQHALLLDRFASVRALESRVRDASDYALERLFARVDNAPAANGFVQEVIGDLIAWDRARQADLVPTLYAWLATGCNATATAAQLYVERQSLHKRLKKIFMLLGGDPRQTGTILQLHLACRIQLAQER